MPETTCVPGEQVTRLEYAASYGGNYYEGISLWFLPFGHSGSHPILMTFNAAEKEGELAIDISALSMNPANSGTLEDCASSREPIPLPDISNLQLEEREPPKPKPAEE